MLKLNNPGDIELRLVLNLSKALEAGGMNNLSNNSFNEDFSYATDERLL